MECFRGQVLDDVKSSYKRLMYGSETTEANFDDLARISDKFY